MPKPATLLAQADHYLDPATGAVDSPPYISLAPSRETSDYEVRGSSYGRRHNPTHEPAERLLAKLEGGEEALLFGSGLAGATALFESLASGDHVVVPKDMYHGLRDWLLDFSERWGLGVDFYDGSELETLRAVLKPGITKLVWIETPSNPTWKITDIAAVARLAHQVGAKVGADSTISTPILTRPLEHGADFVFHSATKYLNGHSDLIAGVLVCKKVDELWDQVRFRRSHGGAILSPNQAWLLLRGMRTLHIRMRQSCENAARVAEFPSGATRN